MHCSSSVTKWHEHSTAASAAAAAAAAERELYRTVTSRLGARGTRMTFATHVLLLLLLLSMLVGTYLRMPFLRGVPAHLVCPTRQIAALRWPSPHPVDPMPLPAPCIAPKSCLPVSPLLPFPFFTSAVLLRQPLRPLRLSLSHVPPHDLTLRSSLVVMKVCMATHVDYGCFRLYCKGIATVL